MKSGGKNVSAGHFFYSNSETSCTRVGPRPAGARVSADEAHHGGDAVIPTQGRASGLGPARGGAAGAAHGPARKRRRPHVRRTMSAGATGSSVRRCAWVGRRVCEGVCEFEPVPKRRAGQSASPRTRPETRGAAATNLTDDGGARKPVCVLATGQNHASRAVGVARTFQISNLFLYIYVFFFCFYTYVFIFFFCIFFFYASLIFFFFV